MEEELISFETANLAKEKGFDTTFGFAFYFDEEKWVPSLYIYTKEEKHLYIARPSQSLLQRWLREVHNIHIYIEPFWANEKVSKNIKITPESYCPWVIYDYIEEDDAPEFYETYEQALEAGLQEALKLIK